MSVQLQNLHSGKVSKSSNLGSLTDALHDKESNREERAVEGETENYQQERLNYYTWGCVIQ